MMVTRTKPTSKTPIISRIASGSGPTWSTAVGPQDLELGSVSYTDRDPKVDWRRVIKEGNDATTAAVGWSRSWRAESTFLLAWRDNFGTTDYTGQQAYDNTSLAYSVTHIDAARQLAIGDFISNCKSVQHAFGAGQFLGELRETVKFLASPIRSLRRFATDYHRRTKNLPTWVGSRKSKLARLSEYWLAYRFGALPLIGDIDSAMHELADTVVGRKPTQPVRGKGVAMSATNDVTSGNNLSIWNYNREVVSKVVSRAIIRGKVRLELPSQLFGTDAKGASTLFRITEDFIPTLYEIMPWSWAVDYFTNLGDVLNCLTYCSGNVVWSNQTLITAGERSERLSYKSVDHPSWHFIASKGRTTTTSYRLWNRDSVPAASLVPLLVFKLPTGHTIQEANLTAALFQKFHR
jgi:hypothetical protein